MSKRFISTNTECKMYHRINIIMTVVNKKESFLDFFSSEFQGVG
jgi:hypothetical protein